MLWSFLEESIHVAISKGMDLTALIGSHGAFRGLIIWIAKWGMQIVVPPWRRLVKPGELHSLMVGWVLNDLMYDVYFSFLCIYIYIYLCMCFTM